MLGFYNSWVLGTLALYYYGPIPWSGQGAPWVAVIVLSALLFFNVGAITGRRFPALPQHDFALLERSPIRWAVAVLFVLLSAFHTYSTTHRLIFNPAEYSLDFGNIYAQYQQVLRDRSTDLLEQLVLLTKALMMPAAFLMIVIAFRRERLLLWLLVFPLVASSMMRGTDKETADLVIYYLILAFYHKMIGRQFILVMVGIAGALSLFTIRKLARFEGVDLQCLPSMELACFDFNNWVSVNLSPGMEFLRIILTNYLTQGLEGLHRATQLPMEFTYFTGHMQPVKDKLCDIGGLLCGVETFKERLPAAGWDTSFRWTSAYTSIANDFHWLFVPFYTFCMGLFFGVSERSWRATGDKLSLAILLLVSLFIVYSPANMQLTVSLEWSAVYLGLFLWQGWRVIYHAPSYPRAGAERVVPLQDATGEAAQ